MKYDTLGSTDLKVSKICLGTMTYGEQNSEAEGHEQMNYAVEKGVNFFDTAEMYSVPARKETYGRTEEIIGSWLKARNRRDDLIIATKAAGPAEMSAYIRNMPDYSRKQLREAVENSLRRLNTDYIDLYQLHWPERPTNYFGQLSYQHLTDDAGTPFVEILRALHELIEEGKIRYIGISNETPWGVSEFLKLAELHDLPQMMSIQNPYNLLNRVFEVGLAEMAIRNRIGLLAYSPMAFGVLSGKYLNGLQPADARVTLYPRFSRYSHELAQSVTQQYVKLARDNDLPPGQMALAFVNSRPFVTSTIIGATSMTQLEENIDSIAVNLSDELLTQIENIHLQTSNPCP